MSPIASLCLSTWPPAGGKASELSGRGDVLRKVRHQRLGLWFLLFVCICQDILSEQQKKININRSI